MSAKSVWSCASIAGLLTSSIQVAGLYPSLILGTPETAYKTETQFYVTSTRKLH